MVDAPPELPTEHADTAERLQALREQRGPIAKVPASVSDRDAILLATPSAVQHVLESNQDNYRKAAGYREELSAIFGQGLLTSEGDQWARQHEVIRPLFTSESIQSFDELVLEATDEMLERWETTTEPIDLLEEMEWLTLLIIGRAMFSADMAGEAETIRDALRTLRTAFKRRTDPTAAMGPDLLVEAGHASQTLNGVVADIIERRRESDVDRDDLVSRLLRAEAELEGTEGNFVRDQIMTFLLAGHETTAAALTWTWFLLAKHPEIHRDLAEHARDVAVAGADDLSYLAPIKRGVQEAMRLYPPVPVFSREAIDDDTIDGHEIPAGTQVFLSQYVVHRDPSIWEEPRAYRPARFTSDDRPRYSYFPFGGGPRMCIGREFALMEAQLILGRALPAVQLSLQQPAAGDSVGVSSAVTMVPADPIEMAVTEW